jgi:hypothetical protein
MSYSSIINKSVNIYKYLTLFLQKAVHIVWCNVTINLDVADL